MKSLLSSLVLGLFLFSFNAFGDNHSSSPVNESKTDAKVPVQNYDGNIKGLKSMMKDLLNTSPSVYEQLLPDYKSLRNRENAAGALLWGGYLGGTGLVIYGFADTFNLFASKGEDQVRNFNWVPILVGVGLTYVSAWASKAIKPGSQSYKDFTNKHNRLNPTGQMEWNRQSQSPMGQKWMQLGFNF